MVVFANSFIHFTNDEKYMLVFPVEYFIGEELIIFWLIFLELPKDLRRIQTGRCFPWW